MRFSLMGWPRQSGHPGSANRAIYSQRGVFTGIDRVVRFRRVGPLGHLLAQQLLGQVVIDRPERLGLDTGRIRTTALATFHLLSEGDDLLQVRLVLNRLLPALLDQRIEHRRHLLVVLRIDRHLVDDEAADIVLDRLGHRATTAPDPVG